MQKNTFWSFRCGYARLGRMARPRHPSDSCGQAKMCGHRLIQRRQVLISLFLQRHQQMWEQLKQKDGCETSGGRATISWARMNFGEEALLDSSPWENTRPACCEMAPQRRPFEPELIDSLCHSSAYRRPHYVTRTAVRGRGQSQSPITPPCPKPPEEKAVIYFTVTSTERTRYADHVEWRGRAISPSVTHTQRESHERAGDSCTSYNDGMAFATTLRWNLLF